MKHILGLIFISVLLVSCSSPKAQPTTDVGAIYTSAVKTASANIDLTRVSAGVTQSAQNAQIASTQIQATTNAYLTVQASLPTSTTMPTPDVTQTLQAQMFLVHPDGFYLVNVDIAPGVWRSPSGSDNCYWATTDKQGNILDNHFGMSGGTAYIPASAFQVEFKDCGDWTFISP